MRYHSGFPTAARVLVAGLLCAGAAWATERGTAARADVAPRPDSRRYVGLGELAAQLGAQDTVDELTGVYSLRRGDRCVSVVPGVSAALVGNTLVELGDEPVVRYGQAYVPRSLESAIRRLLAGGGPPVVSVPPRPPGPTPAKARNVGRICVDAGHGGKDPGAPSRWGLEEKTVVLAAAQELAAELRRRGFDVVMTRESDRFVDLEERPAVAARCRADVFISVHANSIDKPSYRGIELFYPDNRGGSPSSTVRRESYELAKALETAFTSAGLSVRSTRGAGYRVLRLAEMPAVLVEIGFLTNAEEEHLLRTSAHRQRIARAIADGIVLYRRK